MSEMPELPQRVSELADRCRARGLKVDIIHRPSEPDSILADDGPYGFVSVRVENDTDRDGLLNHTSMSVQWRYKTFKNGRVTWRFLGGERYPVVGARMKLRKMADVIFWADMIFVHRPSVTMEDGIAATEGDRVYNFYDMMPVRIVRIEDDGWCDTELDDGARGPMLNGERMCSIMTAESKGFPGSTASGLPDDFVDTYEGLI